LLLILQFASYIRSFTLHPILPRIRSWDEMLHVRMYYNNCCTDCCYYYNSCLTWDLLHYILSYLGSCLTWDLLHYILSYLGYDFEMRCCRWESITIILVVIFIIITIRVLHKISYITSYRIWDTILRWHAARVVVCVCVFLCVYVCPCVCMRLRRRWWHWYRVS